MTRRAVVFINDHASLLLDGIKRDTSGRIKAGYVENGAWYLRVDGNTWHAMHGRESSKPVSSFAVTEYAERAAPKGRDYNDVMARAQESYDKEN